MQAELLVVLVVEDEAAIKDMIDDALSEGGFKALAASSGEEAIALLEAADPQLRALITDINLPG